VIVDGESEVLDVGRAQRNHTPAQWRALVARDRGCVEPGCDRAPGWCDVHHRHPWDDGGETNIENLELRCRRHHRKAHAEGP
jgi:HNH endonuclease